MTVMLKKNWKHDYCHFIIIKVLQPLLSPMDVSSGWRQRWWYPQEVMSHGGGGASSPAATHVDLKLIYFYLMSWFNKQSWWWWWDFRFCDEWGWLHCLPPASMWCCRMTERQHQWLSSLTGQKDWRQFNWERKRKKRRGRKTDRERASAAGWRVRLNITERFKERETGRGERQSVSCLTWRQRIKLSIASCLSACFSVCLSAHL